MSRYQVLLIVLLLCGLTAATAGEVVLVQDGRPRATIVVSADAIAELEAAEQRRREPPPDAPGQPAPPPPSNAAAAALELQHYVRKMSGAELPIVGDDGEIAAPRVLVGRSRLTDAIADLDIPAGLSEDLREEGFIVWCQGDTLVLAGNDEGPYYGTRYAVADLLEGLGVRWVMPGEFGEVVPRHRTLRVPAMSLRERPDFTIRHVTDDLEWQIRNKLNSRIYPWAGGVGDNTLAGSGSHGYIGDPGLFEQHPEWFALNEDGETRNPRMVCMTHPEAIRHVAQKCLAEARAGQSTHSAGHAYSTFAPDDGEPRCYCPNCQRLSLGLNAMISDERSTRPGGFSISQEWFHFVNEVLKQVNAEFPRWRIATNGYANRDVPPELPDFNASGNLVVMYANIYACTLHAWDAGHCWHNQRQGQMIRRWSELSDKVYLYQYNYTMLAGKGTPTPTLTRIARNTRLAQEWGVWGFVEENVDNRLNNSVLERYLRARLYWDAQADPEAILDDVCRAWYGPAAAPMRRYHATLDEAIARTTQHGHEEPILAPVYSDALLAQLERHLRRAEALAGAGPEAQRVRVDRGPDHPPLRGRQGAGPEAQRVRVDRLIHDHLRQYVALENAKRDGDYRQALAHIDNMMALRSQMREISPFILSRHPAHATGIPVYGDVVWEKPVLEKRQAQLDGTEGELVAFLPERARFRTDPRDDGYYERWFEPRLNDRAWQTISTASGWESQGLPGMLDARGFAYKGAAWYRLNVEVPASAEGQRVVLACPSMVNRVLVWVNGRFAGSSDWQNPWFRPNHVEIDVSDMIEPGRSNQITLRVFCNETVWGANGLYERMYLYAPK